MYTYTIEHATYNTYPACKDLGCIDAPPEDNVPLFPTFLTVSRNDDSASRGRIASQRKYSKALRCLR